MQHLYRCSIDDIICQLKKHIFFNCVNMTIFKSRYSHTALQGNESNKIFKSFEHLYYLSWGVLFEIITSFALPCRSVLRVDLYPSVNFPLFITRARRELILSIAFFYKRKYIKIKLITILDLLRVPRK